MSSEKTLHGPVEVEAVGLSHKAVAFVVFDHIFHVHATSSQCLDHLVAFGLVHAWVVGALGHEEWRFDLVGVEGRRGGFESFTVVVGVAHLFIHHLQHWLPIGWDGLHKSEQV